MRTGAIQPVLMSQDRLDLPMVSGRSLSLGSNTFIARRITSHRFPESRHRELQISIPLGGSHFEMIWRADSGRTRSRVLGDGDICIIPSFQSHSIVWQREADLVSFYLDPEFVAAIADECGSGAPAICEQYGIRSPFIRELALAVREEFLTRQEPSRLFGDCAATLLAAHLLRMCAHELSARPATSLTPTVARRVTDYVKAHLDGDLSLDELAAVAGMGKYIFARRFAGTLGMSPHRYVLDRRIERAKALLADGAESIADIALQTGFSSQSHLTSTFRRHVGCTPGAFRRRN